MSITWGKSPTKREQFLMDALRREILRTKQDLKHLEDVCKQSKRS